MMNNSTFNISLANTSDITSILEIVSDARELINNIGFKQWSIEEGYPSYDDFLNDINKNQLYVVKDNNLVVAFFALIVGEDENYIDIDGSWLTNSNNYLTIHRVAVRKSYYGKGLSRLILDYACDYAHTLGLTSFRADTHPLNQPMNKTLLKYGFKYTGIIKILDCQIEPERNAYELLI